MSKDSFIDEIQVKAPCTEDWDEMTGNDSVRFCSHCAKSVNNLSEMTRDAAIRLVRRSGGRLCVRYIKDPRTSTPVFADRLFGISRRAPSMAAGVMTASLSLSTLAYAQGGVAVELPTAQTAQSKERDSKKEKPVEPAVGAIKGTIMDSHGAVVPGATVTLLDSNSVNIRTTSSNEEGAFLFENLAEGNYGINIEPHSGFAKQEIKDIAVSAGSESEQKVTLALSDVTEVVGFLVSTVEYQKPLTLAVQNQEIEEVRNLIAAGANVNEKEDEGKITPLFVAVETGNIEVVRTLLEFGAKVNARDDSKEMPLMRLGEDASRELVDLLIQHGAKVNRSSRDGNTALILAAGVVKPDVLQALIDAGADVNASNDEGLTALMNAAASDDVERVRVLLLAGAEVNAKDKEGETAWDKTSDSEVKELLKSYGAVVKEEAEDEIEEPDTEDPGAEPLE